VEPKLNSIFLLRFPNEPRLADSHWLISPPVRKITFRHNWHMFTQAQLTSTNIVEPVEPLEKTRSTDPKSPSLIASSTDTWVKGSRTPSTAHHVAYDRSTAGLTAERTVHPRLDETASSDGVQPAEGCQLPVCQVDHCRLIHSINVYHVIGDVTRMLKLMLMIAGVGEHSPLSSVLHAKHIYTFIYLFVCLFICLFIYLFSYLLYIKESRKTHDMILQPHMG